MAGQPYYRPWIINITDGEPTDIPNIDEKGNEIKTNVENKISSFLMLVLKERT